MKIDEMAGGREMDQLVAERVMGLCIKWEKGVACPYCGGEMHFLGSRAWCLRCQEYRYHQYKDYSTDIAAAWEVDKEEWYWELLERVNGLLVYVRIDNGRELQVIGVSHVDWAEVLSRQAAYALGRCRAALKALGVTGTEEADDDRP